MSTLKLAFNMFANMGRDLSAKDLEVRLPTQVANPREVIANLRVMGKIERSYRLGREQMYRLVPGATPPEDGRQFNDISPVFKARAKRARAARAVSIRKVRRQRVGA